VINQLSGFQSTDAYSPIVERKDYSWPGDKRLAFYMALNVENFAFGAELGMDPVRSGQQTTRNFAWRDSGNRIVSHSISSAPISSTNWLIFHQRLTVERVHARPLDESVVLHDAARSRLRQGDSRFIR
jgi:hypothetical protein